MAKTILRDCSVTINSVDLSNHVDQVVIETTYDEVDVSTMGDTLKEYLLGLGDGTITVEFLQDWAAASVDATLSPLVGSNTTFPVVVKPTSAAVSATNPSYTMQAVLPTYQPINGSIGQASKISAKFRNAAQSGIVRAVS